MESFTDRIARGLVYGLNEAPIESNRSISCWTCSTRKAAAAAPWLGTKNISRAAEISSHHGHRPAAAR